MQKYIFYAGESNNTKSIDRSLGNNYSFKIWRPKLYKIAPKGLLKFSFFVYWLFHCFRIFNTNFYSIFLIYHKNEIAHYSVVLPKFFKTPFMETNDLQIGPIGTKKDHRKKGLASYSIQKIIKLYENKNKKFWYITRKENIISGKVIKKFGFSAYGEGIKKGKFGIFNIEKKY